MPPKKLTFKNGEFSLTATDVASVREERKRDLAEREAILRDPDEDTRLKRFAESGIEKTRKEAELFGERDDETILGIARTIFERGQSLESSGLPTEEVVATLYEEVPDAEFMYQLLRKNDWGYRLGQTKMAADANLRASTEPK
jgi:hypothetical protein